MGLAAPPLPADAPCWRAAQRSGGALVDLSGRVVGIPTLAALDPELGGSQAPGIGFAIPSKTVQQVASRLIAAGGSS
jgi:S1-C subfamily serine protease